MKQLVLLYKKCRKSNSFFLVVVFKYIRYRIYYRKNFFLHQDVKIKGIENIWVKERLEVGISYVGFMHPREKTFLNIKGKLEISGVYSFGRGCRIDIGENAIVKIGKGGYMNSNTKLIIMHSLSIGDNCAISWDCQFLDDDFHSISFEGKKESDNSIIIGNNVWIGCGVKIYKGSVIPNGCIIASDSIVKSIFNSEDCLIAGSPAKVVKENISWQ